MSRFAGLVPSSEAFSRGLHAASSDKAQLAADAAVVGASAIGLGTSLAHGNYPGAALSYAGMTYGFNRMRGRIWPNERPGFAKKQQGDWRRPVLRTHSALQMWRAAHRSQTRRRGINYRYSSYRRPFFRKYKKRFYRNY